MLQIEGALLRNQLPDLVLRPGMTLSARLAERAGRHGIIVLAGTPLLAELPDELKPGDKLRMMVQQSRTDKVVLKLIPEETTAPPPPAATPLALPGAPGAHVRVDDEDPGSRGGGDSGRASVALTYESPALGPVGLRLELAPGAITVHAELAAGRPFELAGEHAEELRARLAEVTGRTPDVQISPRRQPLDVYA